MSSNKPQFLKTIRFKLTLVYSLITFLFCAILVVSLNLYLNSYLRSDPPSFEQEQFRERLDLGFGRGYIIEWKDLGAEERNRIREFRLNDLRQIQNSSLLSIFPIALLSFGLGYVLSGRFLKPIAELSSQFENLRTRDLGKTIPVTVDDEVGELISSFNQLSQRLKTSFETQEQFVQDASHELKTPLTVIQTNLDTVADDPEASREELRQAVANALIGMRHIRKLTENLLELSSPESVSSELIDLNDLVRELLSQLKPLADKVGIKLRYSSPDKKYSVSGDSLSLSRALGNIIENGIKYGATAEKPELEIRITAKAKSVTLSITDNGPGIPEEHQPHIFERFYRVDKARSRKNGGFGLGLAISKKIITEQGGRLSFTSNPGKTSFLITLPLAGK